MHREWESLLKLLLTVNFYISKVNTLEYQKMVSYFLPVRLL